MTQRIFDFHFFSRTVIGKEYLDCIGNRSLVRLKVVAGVARILLHKHFYSERIDARILGESILVMVSGQPAEYQRNGGHILQAVIAVGWVIEGPRLIDDTNGRFLGRDDHLPNIV